MRSSNFIFDVSRMQRIDSPIWIKSKKATINPRQAIPFRTNAFTKPNQICRELQRLVLS